MKMIYLDNQRATKPSSRVVEKICEAYKNHWIEIGAAYFQNVTLFREIETALRNIYDLIGASNDNEFIVTGGDRDAVCLAFHQICCEVMSPNKKHVVWTPETEHAPIREGIAYLGSIGYTVQYLPANEEGEISIDMLEKYYTPQVSLLAMSWANALTGVVHPMWDISQFCAQRGIVLYVQASEVVGKIFVKFGDLPIDFLSFSADKLYGPKGIGGLFTKKKESFFSLEKINNLPGLLGMGVAAEEALCLMDTMNMEMAYLRSHFEETLHAQLPDLQFFYQGHRRLPNVSCFGDKAIHGELLTFALSRENVFVSYGGGYGQRLEYLVGSPSAITVALGRSTSESELNRAIQLIVRAVHALKSLYVA